MLIAMVRDLEDLERHAAKFWPPTLAGRERNASIIPKLIESQDKFISILFMADASPVAWKEALGTTRDLPGNLFLKHVIVLADVGGEKLQRFHRDLRRFFPEGV